MDFFGVVMQVDEGTDGFLVFLIILVIAILTVSWAVFDHFCDHMGLFLGLFG